MHFIDEIVETNHTVFSKFNPLTDRVDTLLHGLISKHKQYENFWKLCYKLLLLSHSQAYVERGFSVNRQIEVENKKNETFVGARCICDYIKAAVVDLGFLSP